MEEKDPISYSEEDWNSYKLRQEALEKAAKVYEQLRLELGTREDNEHVGSGLGGNPSELFFLLSHPVKLGISKDDQPHFSRIGSIEILLELPKSVKMKTLRKELTKFFNSHPDKLHLSMNQILDPAFLREHQNKTLDVKLLAKAIAETKNLVEWLDIKMELQKEIRKVSSKEQAAITAAFLKELELPENFFETDDYKNNDECPIRRMLREHPVWGVKQEAINKRYSDIEFALLSREELDKLKFVGTFPSFIALFTVRALIGIERLVCLNLDERDECQFLGTINKKIDS